MSEEADGLLIRIIEIAMRTRPDEHGRVRLPTERELSELLDVQRPTVRERLTVLETLGFVNRRQGSGTFLSLPNAQVLQFYFEVSLKLGFLSLDQIQKALEMIGMEMAPTPAAASYRRGRRAVRTPRSPARNRTARAKRSRPRVDHPK